MTECAGAADGPSPRPRGRAIGVNNLVCPSAAISAVPARLLKREYCQDVR
jgi:hypothetical protein